MSGPMLTLRGALEEIIPALLAAGLSEAAVRGIVAETHRRVGEGAREKDWLLTMAVVVADRGDETAMRAYKLAIDEWSK